MYEHEYVEILDKDFKPHFIAYFDILGYKQHMEKGRAVEIANKISYTIEKMRNEFELYRLGRINSPPENEAKLKVFSDNFIVFSEHDWLAVFQSAARVQMTLALNNVFVRGSLCYGELFFDDEFLCGEGIVLAHEIESQNAIYPRIIVDQKFVEEAKKRIAIHVHGLEGESPDAPVGLVEKMLHKELEDISTDFDGCMFVDYLKAEVLSYEVQKNVHNLQAIADMLSLHKENIECNMNSDNRKILQKYQWCKNYHNHFCQENNYPAFIIGNLDLAGISP